ncbi:hypothetical protein [Mycobacterium sp.]|uniref:hypothetical protein n=1 Tax=Mycobacterium sp. TaxID=1785 RepID=UPI002D0C981A|nr:hypothetical protein [Mycobacterium sp.]HME47218.1 hypothetical protein [Mycobacterium sp.]
MTIRAAHHDHEQTVVPAEQFQPDIVEPAPALITEREVLFGTAAARHRRLAASSPRRPARTRRQRRSPS